MDATAANHGRGLYLFTMRRMPPSLSIAVLKFSSSPRVAGEAEVG